MLRIIRKAHEKARGIISEHLDIMNEAAEYLMERESITGDEFMRIVRKYVPARK